MVNTFDSVMKTSDRGGSNLLTVITPNTRNSVCQDAFFSNKFPQDVDLGPTAGPWDPLTPGGPLLPCMPLGPGVPGGPSIPGWPRLPSGPLLPASPGIPTFTRKSHRRNVVKLQRLNQNPETPGEKDLFELTSPLGPDSPVSP